MSTWDGQLAALDPAASVVVEACAGSGKTWLLVARIVRLLLAGVAPGEILAITYTRKAAREIESRLRGALREMALQPEEGLRQFLQQIGAASAAAECARARKLFEQVGGAQPPITVSTFHGWFAGLLKAAPLNTGLAGFELAQSETRLRDEVWQLFARDCGAQPQQSLTQSLLWLMQELGLDALRRLLFGFIARRAEWHAFCDDGAAGFEAALERLRRDLGVAREPAAVADFWAQPGLGDELAHCAALLEQDGTQTHRELAACLRSVLALEPDGEARFEGLGRVFVKADGEPREIRGGQAMAKRLGAAAAARLVELHRRLGERFRQARRTRQEEAVFRFHCHALRVADAFLGSFERFKAERRMLDFADLEWHADRLLRDADTAGFLLARLDARYRHVLVDEFQDTNPLQWRILQAWLGAYDRPEEVPRLFLVGDPKQSIYRFRRAEPRLFETARGMLERQHGARLLANDLTRRNSPVVIEVVNRVFADQPSFAGFRAHTAFEQGLAGRVEVLPLCAPDAAEREQAALADDAAAPLRNPLRAAAQESEDRRRRCEAQRLVARLRQVVGHWPVREGASERPARYSDVMILTRRRSVLPEFERALRAAGMPYLSVGRGGLLATLEAADLVALLRFLCVPAADLALAHALRSPLFALSDGDLMQIAAAAGDDWWSRLQRLAGLGQAGAAVARAARLLDAWLASAARLPVHDLLDRIYAEGELVARYRAAVAPAMWPGVEANLEAFIDLALAIDGGRYPSLPRFIDELDRLGQAADEDAPDEGVVRPAEDGAGHLRILTIHAAKGLEAPIVWLIDAHNTHRVPDIWRVLLDWPPGAQAPAHFSLTTSRERRGNARDALFQAEELAQEREELNLLYVALTRARQYFFASGIEPLRRGRPNSAWERLAAAIGGAAEGGAWGAPPVEMTAVPPRPMAVPLPDSAASPAPVGVRRAALAPAAEAALAFGVALHRALELMAASGCKVPPPPAAMAPGQWESVLASARAILAAPHLRLFFDPACFRRALNEVEFALPDGTLGRIDRLVDTGAEIWVLDYKSGGAVRSEDYRQQLEGYRAAMLPIAQGRPVRCALIFGDAALVEMC